MAWDWRTERNEKHRFVEERLQHRRPVLGSALIFLATWLSGWACSALLLQAGMPSIPGRYAVSFLVSYGLFFGVVRIWCRFSVKPVETRARKDTWVDGGLHGLGAGGEVSAALLALLAIGFLLSGILWLAGGYAMLLEVAFEVAFAGTLVQKFERQHRLGNWAWPLLKRTWLPALLVGAILVGFSAKMQRDHPEAHTLGQAFKALRAKNR